MFRWFKKKCTKKHSKRLRTSSIGDWTRNNDYTSHPDTNIYHEIDDAHIAEAYAVTSIEDLLDMDQSALTEVCPLCRQHRHGPNRNCKCFDQSPASPFKIRQDLTDDDDFSWLEYDFKDSSKSSLHRSRSEIRGRPSHKKPGKSDDSCSSGYYETDDSCDDITISPVYRPIPAPRTNPRLPGSPSLVPKMGCKIIKRSQSAVNPKQSRFLRRSQSDYFTPMKIVIEDKEMSSVVIDSVFDTVSRQNSKGTQQSEDEDEDDIFDHFYSNVCIDINNLEIPKLRKSSYRSRSHGQNRLLNDLLKQNHDKQNFTGVRK